MARTKQAHRSAGESKKPKRATFKGRKRDPTPEPSHPDNPCPTQVIGEGPGCNLCFPDIKCKPGERQACQVAWAEEHFRAAKAVQQKRQQHEQLEDQVKKLQAQAYCKNSTSPAKSQQCAGIPSPMISPSPIRVHSGFTYRGGPRLFCKTCNAPIEDMPLQAIKRRHTSRFFYKGMWQQPQLQCTDCKRNGGPSTSSASEEKKITECNILKKLKHTSEKLDDGSCELSSSSMDENVIVISSSTESNLLPASKSDSDIYDLNTCSEISSDDDVRKVRNKSQCSSSSSGSKASGRKKICKHKAASSHNNPNKCSDEKKPTTVDNFSQFDKEHENTHHKSNAVNTDDWRRVKPTALAQFRHMLDHELYTDCRLVVTYNGEQQAFSCHKLVLARASSVFAESLYGTTTNCGVIQVEDLQPQAVRSMLIFVYTDRVSLNGVDDALAVCAAARRYNINALIAYCCSHITRHMSSSTVCRTVEFARKHELSLLQENCVKLIREHTQEVLETPEFLSAECSTLELILEQSDLNVTSELCLITACEKWAQNQTNDHNASLIEVLGSARLLLRFLSLSAAQFAQGPAHSSVLSQDEKLAIFVALASPPGSRQGVLPNGLSIERRVRSYPQVYQHDFPLSD